MWEVTIEVLDINASRVKIVAIRTDTGDGLSFSNTYRAIIESPAQRTAILNQIKLDYLDYLSDLNDADDVIAGLEDTATNNLNSWEATL